MKVTNKNFGSLLAAVDLATSTPYLCNLPELLEDTTSSWVTCDGRLLSRVEFNELYSIIGTHYGGSSTSYHFNLPDYRGRTPLPPRAGDPGTVLIKIRPDDGDNYPVGSTIIVARK